MTIQVSGIAVNQLHTIWSGRGLPPVVLGKYRQPVETSLAWCQLLLHRRNGCCGFATSHNARVTRRLLVSHTTISIEEHLAGTNF